MRNPWRAAAVVALVGSLALAACGGSSASEGGSGSDSSSSGAKTTLNLVAFSVPKAAHDAAQKAWGETPDGKGVTWRSSYGPSGDQSRAVAGGLKADLVHFSLGSDVTRLVDSGQVAKDWNTGPTKGIASSTVVVLVVRKGNPKNIKGWDDVVKPGIGIVSPNPGSSGSARWNILAAYGHVIAKGGTPAEAEAFLTKLFKNVKALPGSGRDATTAFQGGTGDVLLSYESEAILARQSGADFDYIVPDETLLIENPAAVTEGASAKAKDYLDYIESKDGQTVFAEKGWRPVVDGVDVTVKGANDPSDPFPTPEKLLTIDGDFGGWSDAGKKFFDEDNGIVTKIQQATGKS